MSLTRTLKKSAKPEMKVVEQPKKFDLTLTYDKLVQMDQILSKEVPPHWSSIFINILNTLGTKTECK